MQSGTKSKLFRMFMLFRLPMTHWVSISLNCGKYFINIFFKYIDWFGVIFVRHGPYEGAVFRFHIYIPKTFPKSDIPVRQTQDTPFSYFYTLILLLPTDYCIHSYNISPKSWSHFWVHGDKICFWEVAMWSPSHLAFASLHQTIITGDRW